MWRMVSRLLLALRSDWYGHRLSCKAGDSFRVTKAAVASSSGLVEYINTCVRCSTNNIPFAHFSG